MSDLDRRLATLAALFAPARAGALLDRLATPAAPDAALHARKLTASPRSDRLRALAETLAFDGAAVRASAADAAAAERAAVAALLRALAADVAVVGASPLVLRLCRERLGR